MSMLDGLSQCWWLGNTCAVDWEAWSAMGTVAAVFAAVFAPSIQRRFVRRKANAIFALAFRTDMATARIDLERLRAQFPLSPSNADAWAVHSAIQAGGHSQKRFVEMFRQLDLLGKREVDITRWPAVDLELAALVAFAIEHVRHFQIGAETIAATRPGDAWSDLIGSVDSAERVAYESVSRASAAIARALRSSKITSADE